MTTDPLDLELVRHGLESMVDEMAMAMIRTCRTVWMCSSSRMGNAWYAGHFDSMHDSVTRAVRPT